MLIYVWTVVIPDFQKVLPFVPHQFIRGLICVETPISAVDYSNNTVAMLLTED